MIRTCVSTILTLIASFVFAAVPGWADNTRPNGAPPDGARAVRTSTTVARETAVKLDGFAPTPELGTVHFDFDKAVIRPTEARALDKHAQWLKANSGAMVAVDGGADQRGSVVYNQRLSERRAKAVKDYLVNLGVSASRITIVSKGKESPFCTDKNEACWQQNRRGHFIITAK